MTADVSANRKWLNLRTEFLALYNTANARELADLTAVRWMV